MKHAFLIQVHKNFEQIKILVNDIITNNRSGVYVHVDLKNDLLYKELKQYYINNYRVTAIEQRESVYWADFSQVKATINLFTSAAVKGYDYYSLISGQDYMIKSLQEFNAFLEKNKGLEFIEARKRNNSWRVRLSHKHTRNPKFRKYRYYRYYALFLSILNYQKKQFIEPYQIYFGSSWFTITNSAVNYVLDFIKKNPGFIEDFKTSTCGDEHFFQTILMNSKFKNKIYNDNLRFAKFKSRTNSPIVLTTDNYKELIDSSKFIARKFDLEINKEIISQLQTYIK